MKENQTPLFATSEDWNNVVSNVLSKHPLAFVKMGMFDVPKAEGLGDGENFTPFASYLALESADKVIVRTVLQLNGDKKHAIDQLENPGSIILQVGGMDNDRLVAGQIGTVRTEQAAKDLYAVFLREIKKQFSKIKSYYVGPEAVRLLDAGRRLSPTSKSPPEYDLTR